MDEQLYTFSENGQACVIHSPEPPRHWYNYLWNEDRYCMQVSQTGHGSSYYLSEKAEMCRINKDGQRYIFLRDDESGTAWNIGQGPLNTPVEDYRCTHAIACTEIASRFQGISASWRLFVPEKGYHELWTVRLRNEGDQPKHLSMFAVVSFELEGFAYPRYYEMYRCMTTRFDRELNGVYCQGSHPFAPHACYNGFLAASEPVFAFDGDLTAFCGSASTLTERDASTTALFQRPDVVMQGRDCTGSEVALFILGGVLQHKITLQPREEKVIHYAYGIAASVEEARDAAGLSDETVESELHKAQEAYLRKYQFLSVQTPDAKVNAIMNTWVQKQVNFCVVGKKGVRDNLQIAVAMLNFRPEKAKEEILECLRHQFRDGHGVLTWYPYDDTRYSDQPFWIIWAVCELIKETGDFSILQTAIAWQDGGEATVWEHVQAAVHCLSGDTGKHGLVRLRFADWNDALNVTDDPDAESVMLSCQFCLALRELAKLADRMGEKAYAAELRAEYSHMRDIINTHAWDGAWYKRVLSGKGDIGGKDSPGSQIYANAQTWAILAGIPEGERLEQTLTSLDAMEQDFGFPLNLPPYACYDAHVGRMSGMLPGLFENGGVYCHATAFTLLMDAALGRGEKAIRTLKKIMPDSEQNPSSQSGAEPYVFTNCYATHPGYYGKSYQSWTTGTSAWCLRGLYEGVLGINRDYEGLRMAPSLPADWTEVQATRSFRGANYYIRYRNPDGLRQGIWEVYVDGQHCPDDLIPDFQDHRIHQVEVQLKGK